MAHKLPDLPYAKDSLEPHIDAETMRIHHDMHHNAYVNFLNAALEDHADLQEKSAFDLLVEFDSLPDAVKPAVQKHAGGHVNHSMFWTLLSANGGGEPSGALATEINETFGSFDDFKAAFSAAAGGVFGSGWAWLVVDGEGNLKITTTANQDNPVFTEGSLPIMGVDVWEHAYYLKYQNRRPEYLGAFFNVVDWDQVGSYLAMVRAGEKVIALSDWVAAKRARLEELLGSLTE
ncbi:MAG: superoxide dismutase [Acidobacteria bacterium]|nr:superoxide dismutase [Acidobacteriota bacterium]